MSERIIELHSLDGVKINGYLMSGDRNNKNVLIEIHGMTSNCFKKRERVIAKTLKNVGIDTICINTRGSEIVKYIKYNDVRRELAGTAYEDIEESYYDLMGVIKYALSLGYKDIYLQGHSLGATKVVYTYTKMKEKQVEELKNIKGIILLSLVDIPDMFKTYFSKKYLSYAEEKEKNGQVLELMPHDTFIHPISVKTYLKYAKYNSEIDFAQYSNENYDFDTLNKIDVPLFMRWGNDNELIRKSAQEQVELMRRVIKKKDVDINFIDGANHSYNGKETELANDIATFLKKVQ